MLRSTQQLTPCFYVFVEMFIFADFSQYSVDSFECWFVIPLPLEIIIFLIFSSGLSGAVKQPAFKYRLASGVLILSKDFFLLFVYLGRL